MLEKLKELRIMLITVLGLAPYVLDAVTQINLEDGLLAAISTAALAVVGLLASVTKKPKPVEPPAPPSETPEQ